MRIAQILLPGASEYERKSQRIDFAALTAAGHQVTVVSDPKDADADLAHVYSPSPLPSSIFHRFTVPYVANAAPRPSRLPFRRPTPPTKIVSPLSGLPEAVEDTYFNFAPPEKTPRDRYRLGTFGPGRTRVQELVALSLHRLHRFRDDVDWLLFEQPPSPEELASVDAWVDPGSAEDDFDGFVAEALVVGLAVVAVRTPINLQRTEKGRTALLVPPDPNELTHAILAALFKAEVHRPRIEAARQTISKFRSRHRLRVLAAIYEQIRK